jgi:hypothetical protein
MKIRVSQNGSPITTTHCLFPIIAIDPASQSSPKANILDLFSSALDDLDKAYWDNEAYYMSPNRRVACHPSDNDLHRDKCLQAHRYQQWHFVMKCMETFKSGGKLCVLLTDVDE